VAVGGGAHDRFGCQVGAGAGPVLDHRWLPEPLGEPLRDQARGDVGGAARGKPDEQAYRTARIRLRPRDARDRQQRGGARGEIQKSAARQVHGVHVRSPLGRRTVKTEPLPDSLATVTSPPIMQASLRVMARPSPVPPYCRAVEESACVNSSNSLACCSGVIPMPVSATAISIQLRPSTTPLTP